MLRLEAFVLGLPCSSIHFHLTCIIVNANHRIHENEQSSLNRCMLSGSPSISFSSTIPHPALQVIQAANAPRSLFQTFIAKQSRLPQSQPHMMEGCLYSLNWATTWLDFWTDLIAIKIIFMLCNYLQGCILHHIKEIHLGSWSLNHGWLNGQSQSVHKIDKNFVPNCTLYLKNSYFSPYKTMRAFSHSPPGQRAMATNILPIIAHRMVTYKPEKSAHQTSLVS